MSDDTSDLQGQLTALQSRVGALEGKVTALHDEIAALKSQNAGADTDADDGDISFPLPGAGP